MVTEAWLANIREYLCVFTKNRCAESHERLFRVRRKQVMFRIAESSTPTLHLTWYDESTTEPPLPRTPKHNWPDGQIAVLVPGGGFGSGHQPTSWTEPGRNRRNHSWCAVQLQMLLFWRESESNSTSTSLASAPRMVPGMFNLLL